MTGQFVCFGRQDRYLSPLCAPVCLRSAPSPGSSSGGSGGAEPVTHATGVNVFDVTVTNGIVTFRYVVDNAALSEVTFTISVDGAKFEPLVVKVSFT